MHVKLGDGISISDVVIVGVVGYSIEKSRKEYRDNWVLSYYKINLVESGEYEPEQFFEEELEDNDYYEEDE